MKYSDIIISILGLIFNFTLIFLVIKIKSEEFTIYKRIVFFTTSYDILFCIVIVPMHISMEPHDGYILIYGHGENNFMFAMAILLCLFFASFGNNIIIFFYRYLIIRRNYCLSKKQYFLLHLVNIIYCFGGVPLWINAFYSANRTFSKEKKSLIPYCFNLSFDNKMEIYFLMIKFQTNEGILLALHISLLCFLICLENVMSKKSKELYKQLNITMIMQAITPLIICALPILIIILWSLLKVNLNGISTIFFITFKLVPLLNSIVTIWFINIIKRTLFDMFRKLQFCEKRIIRLNKCVKKPNTNISS
uniref:G_PROTEIN_RECEP_F1_2 domain-containing protein n=1 Tax=Parastrongyloides trichosuri TaxID=131310 RepID=A0A0N4ZT70_PARTI